MSNIEIELNKPNNHFHGIWVLVHEAVNKPNINENIEEINKLKIIIKDLMERRQKELNKNIGNNSEEMLKQSVKQVEFMLNYLDIKKKTDNYEINPVMNVGGKLKKKNYKKLKYFKLKKTNYKKVKFNKTSKKISKKISKKTSKKISKKVSKKTSKNASKKSI